MTQEDKKFTWDEFRREVAMRAMQGLINNQKANHDEIQAIVVAQDAVKYADALIEQLKKS